LAELQNRRQVLLDIIYFISLHFCKKGNFMPHCKSLFRAIGLFIFGCTLGLSACTPAALLPTASPTAAPSSTPAITATATLTFTPTSSATPQPTVTVTSTPTPAFTNTPSLSPTPTVTHTPHMVYNLAGDYDQFGKCFTHLYVTVDPEDYETICVDRVTVLGNDSLQFYVSWSYHPKASKGWGAKTDGIVDSSLIFLTDNLGNKYFPTSVGGDATVQRPLDNLFLTGWFIFPKPAQEATSYSFNYLNRVISGIKLIGLVY
jgi:hypothetical protein